MDLIHKKWDPAVQEQRKAKAFVLVAFRRARKAGLDPDTIVIDDDGKLKKTETQLRILTWAGLSVVIAPYAYYGLKFLAAVLHVTYDFPEAEFNKFEFLNLGAVMAYGFSSGVRALLQHKREVAIDAIQTGIQTVQDLSLSMPPTQLKDVERISREAKERFTGRDAGRFDAYKD